jgi:hypothetical protein
MKIIFEYTGEAKRITELTTDTESIYDVLQDIAQLLVAYGFHPDTVKNGFHYMSDEYYAISENKEE